MAKIPSTQNKPNTFLVRANTYPITLDGRAFYHYKFHVKTKAVVAIAYGKHYLYKIFQELLKNKVLPLVTDPVYVMDDQGNVYSPAPLLVEQESFKTATELSIGTTQGTAGDRRLADCQVHLELIEEIDPEALLWGSVQDPTWLTRVGKVTKVLNTVINYGTLKPNHQIIRNTVFSEQPGQCITGGLQAVRGFSREVLPTKDGPVLNVAEKVNVFYKPGTALDLATEFLGLESPGEFTEDTLKGHVHENLSIFLNGLHIVRKFHQDFSKTMTVVAIHEKSARNTVFDDVFDKKRSCSIAEYHQRRYGITLAYPDAPCLHLGRWNVLPMELCTVHPGNIYQGKLNDKQFKQLVTVCRSSPDVGLEKKIQASMTAANLWDQPLLDKFGLSISHNMVETEAKILPPPTLTQALSPEKGTGQVLVTPVNGCWDMKDKGVLKSAMIRLRGVILIQDPAHVQSDKQDIKEFMQVVSNRMNDWRMTRPMYTPKFIHCIDHHANTEGAIHNIDQQACQFMGDKRGVTLVFLGSNYTKWTVYREIKRMFDTVIGQPSICLEMSNVREMNKGYIDNVLLKINAKLNGTNFSLTQDFHLDKSFPAHMLVVGIALNGPIECQSIPMRTAAVVGSMNRELQQFTSEYSYQKPEISHVQHLESLFVKVLESYRKQVGSLPEFILCYRLDVSDTQFEIIRGIEVTAISRACKKVWGSNVSLPRLTYVACQRQHDVLFAPAKVPNTHGYPTGTLVEKRVGLPDSSEFYLLSKRPSHGLGKPVRYIVLHNEASMDLENIQLYTYALCYMVPCNTQSAYLCAPLVMAEILAKHAEFYVWGSAYKPLKNVPGHEKKVLSMQPNKELGISYGQVPEQLKETLYFL
ncbi:hypothetical protein IWQ61_010128 [Dispira simplex]|nr:hypothetical protein IWQ61_010128 [Dispira simplex]